MNEKEIYSFFIIDGFPRHSRLPDGVFIGKLVRTIVDRRGNEVPIIGSIKKICGNEYYYRSQQIMLYLQMCNEDYQKIVKKHFHHRLEEFKAELPEFKTDESGP